MRGDFSRDSFHPLKQFQRVLLQQGRVLLDADWNEQAAILLYQIRQLAKTLIGDAGGAGASFQIVLADNKPAELKDLFNQLMISPGTYWVEGYACENQPVSVTFGNQPFLKLTDAQAKALRDQFGNFRTALAFLAVSERQVTYLQDPLIREVALGMNGPDTATRSQLVWQVRLQPVAFEGDPETEKTKARDLIKALNKAAATAKLRAFAKKPADSDEAPCSISPASQYRGPENQLYRVEIHRGGKPGSDPKIQPSFKWSRENASVCFPVLNVSNAGDNSDRVSLGTLGRDQRFGLKVNDWVEFSDDSTALFQAPHALVQVTGVFPNDRAITVQPSLKLTDFSVDRHPVLCRWDHQAGVALDGGIPVKEAADENDWTELESGVMIQFQSGGQTYRAGEAWLIPARVETGDVEWPYDLKPAAKPGDPPVRVPRFESGRGEEVFFAPLQILTVDANGKWVADPNLDLRNVVGP